MSLGDDIKSKLRGTMLSLFGVGTIIIKDASGVVHLRDLTDGAFVDLTAKNATFDGYKVSAAAAVTLASDAFVWTKSYHVITSQSGTADDLATISGATGNTRAVLQAATTHTITVKNGTGNIFLNGAADFSLSGDKTLELFYDGTNWSDIGAGGNVLDMIAIQVFT